MVNSFYEETLWAAWGGRQGLIDLALQDFNDGYFTEEECLAELKRYSCVGEEAKTLINWNRSSH